METLDAATIAQFNTLTQYLKDRKWTEFLELYNSMGRDTQCSYARVPTNIYCSDDQTEEPETKEDGHPASSE